MKKAKTAGFYTAVVILVILIGLFAAVAVCQKTGKAFVITNGSMSPTLGVGDIVFLGSPDDVKVGDVVTMRLTDGDVVTHRVVGTADGALITQGDANEAPDTFQGAEVIGVVKFQVPVIGKILTLGRSGAYLSDGVKAGGKIMAAVWEVEEDPATPTATEAVGPAGAVTTTTLIEVSWTMTTGEAKAVRSVQGGRQHETISFPIASLDKECSLKLDFGELEPGNTSNSSDVFRIKNTGDGPVEFAIAGEQGFEDFIARILLDNHTLPVLLQPGEERSVDIKLGIPSGSSVGDYHGVIRVVAEDGSCSVDIPALVTVPVKEGRGNGPDGGNGGDGGHDSGDSSPGDDKGRKPTTEATTQPPNPDPAGSGSENSDTTTTTTMVSSAGGEDNSGDSDASPTSEPTTTTTGPKADAVPKAGQTPATQAVPEDPGASGGGKGASGEPATSTTTSLPTTTVKVEESEQ